jgi:hypothetical protein
MRRRSGLIDNSFVRRPAPQGADASSRNGVVRPEGHAGRLPQAYKLNTRSLNQRTTAQRFSTTDFIVILAKAGIHLYQVVMDSGAPLRCDRNDRF